MGSALLSALLCLTLAAFWIRSASAFDTFGYGHISTGGSRIRGVAFSGGDFSLASVTDRGQPASFTRYRGWFHETRKVDHLTAFVAAKPASHSFFVVHWSSNDAPDATERYVAAPLWLAILASMSTTHKLDVGKSAGSQTPRVDQSVNSCRNRLRYSLGVTATILRNVLLKALWSLKPNIRAISARGRSELMSSWAAAWMRERMTNC